MNKPAGRKKAASPKPALAGKRSSPKKKGPSKKGVANKKEKAKRAAKKGTATKKAKAATKPAAKSLEKIKKPSLEKKTDTKQLKKAGKSPAAVKTSKRRAAGKGSPKKKTVKTARKKPVKKTAKRTLATAKLQPKKKPVPVTEEKSARPIGGVKIAEAVVRRELPQEYGENEVILMAVDPNIIFVDWEIKKEEIPSPDTPIAMRVFDVTAGHATPKFPEILLELILEGRTGCGFFDIGMPGRDVAIEIGLKRNGTFLAILESTKVSMPELIVFDELGIAQALFASGVQVGY